MGRGDPQIDVFVDTVQKIAPDVLLITDIDWDYHDVAVDDLADKIGDFPFRLSLRPNSGMPTGIDLDGDGRLGSPGDAQGFGWFVGQGGMALLSKYPMQLIADHSALLWSEQPDSLLFDGMTQEARNVQRLSSSGHWEVLVSGIYLLAFAAARAAKQQFKLCLRTRDCKIQSRAAVAANWPPTQNTKVIRAWTQRIGRTRCRGICGSVTFCRTEACVF